MTTFEITALAIIGACAVIIVLLGVHWDVQDRKPLDPPPIRPRPPYRARHSTDGETTRLKPPPMRYRD